MWTIASIVDVIATEHPRRIALRHGDAEVSWSELAHRSAAIAAWLESEGHRPGEVVAICLPNGPAYLEVFLAALRAGLTPMNANYRYHADELAGIWSDCSASVVIFDARFAADAELSRDRLPGVRSWVMVNSGGIRRADAGRSAGTYSYDSLFGNDSAELIDRSGEDTVILLYTGGTTGRPKGVMWRQADLLSLLNSLSARPMVDHATADQVASYAAGATRFPVGIAASPLMHGAGLFFALSTLLACGTAVTLPSLHYDPELLLDMIEQTRATTVAIVGDAFAGPLLAALDTATRPRDLSSLRALISSGVIWSAAVKAALLNHLPRVRLIDGLGSSEASGIASAEADVSGVPDTAVFRPSERAAVLCDDGTFAQPGDGRIGRLAVTGWIPVGYLNDPGKTAATFLHAGGRRWSVPGDLAQVLPDGRLRLLGRGTSVINTGGEKVFPEEVEEVIKQYRGVRDAVVVGVPDERFGQRVAALVSADAGTTTDKIVGFVRARLAGYKVPREVLFVPTIDRLANGKLDRRALGRQVAESIVRARAND